jgi:hypothetical protein
MWHRLPVHNLISAQRDAALEDDGLAIKRAYDEGYHVEADRLLDALAKRLRAWREDSMGDPGLEPGTSSLSEKRSNRLS